MINGLKISTLAQWECINDSQWWARDHGSAYLIDGAWWAMNSCNPCVRIEPVVGPCRTAQEAMVRYDSVRLANERP